jgi:hypothetical protein
MRIYARCMTGLEDVWISRVDGTLHLEDGEAVTVVDAYWTRNLTSGGRAWHQLAEPVPKPFGVLAGQRAKRLDVGSAPGRIRTCAHGSGEFAGLTL